MKFFTKSAWGFAAAFALTVNFASAKDAPSPEDGSNDSATKEPQKPVSAPTRKAGAPDVTAPDTQDQVDDVSAQPQGASEESEQQRTLNACIAHHEKAQLARLSGGFLEALRELSACAAPECPQVLRFDCLNWRSEVEGLTPTLIVVAEDDSGDVEEAMVIVDGSVLRKRLDGRPLSLDPGTHLVRVELPNGEAREQRVVLSEGERNRRVSFAFRSPPADPTPKDVRTSTKTIRPIPPGVFLLGATAFASVGVAIGFGSDAYSKSRTARDLCAPLCSPEVSRAVTERAAIADVALGVAVAATIGAVVIYSYRPERVVVVDGVSLDLVPEVGGSTVSLRGALR